MKKELDKGYVWYGTRVGLIILVAYSLIEIITGHAFSILPKGFSVLIAIALVFTFVASIIHLRKYKKKTFAIVALVFSSIFLIFVIFNIFSIYTFYGPRMLYEDGTLDSYEHLFLPIPVYPPVHANINVTTDVLSNIYILEEDEYYKYRDEVSFQYIVGSENSSGLEISKQYMNTGYYYLVIDGLEGPVVYQYSLSLMPASYRQKN